MIRRLEFKSKAKNIFIGASVLGLIMIILGLIVNHDQPERLWANFLLGTFYFTGFSVLAVAFMSIQYLASSAWSVSVKRIFEAMGMFIPVGLVAMLVLFLASFFGTHSGMHAVYEWSNPDKVNGDAVLTGKSGYLNVPFWTIRVVLLLGIWTMAGRTFRKYSLNEDEVGGMSNYNKSYRLSAFFLPFFGFTFCLGAIDWLMSVQPHWYSTMFEVNVFAGALVGMMTMTNIIIIIMKKNGYMEWVNENHMHDISKFMFGFSIFWCYTWVCQYLLIWYANLPDETIYYVMRMHGGWKALFFSNVALNFFAPFLLFMMRNAKRNLNWVLFVCMILVVGKYLDLYMMIMPSTAGKTAGFGFYEIGFWLFFAGIFAYVVTASLAKANLIPQKHPYLGESLHHEI